MIYEDYERWQWRAYTADVLGIIGTTLLALGGQDAKLPLFTEIIYPETAVEPPQQTVEDAKAHVYDMFGITPEMLKGEGVTE
jgi:hypothetical protein